MEKTLELTIFAKKRTSKDGKKTFLTYFTTMPGRDKANKVKFREECGAPDCPAISFSARAIATWQRKPIPMR